MKTTAAPPTDPVAHEAFSRAARALWSRTPWDDLAFEVVLRVDVASIGLEGGCLSVLGGEHDQRALALFSSHDDYERWVEHVDDGTATAFERLVLEYDEAYGPEDAEGEHGAVPRVRRERDGAEVDVSPADLARITLVAEALALLEERHRELLAVSEVDEEVRDVVHVQGMAVLLTHPDPRIERGAPPRAPTLDGSPNPYQLPLSADTLGELARLLRDVSLHTVVGMFGAVVSVPVLPSVDAWLGQVLSRARPAREADLHGLADLLMRVYGHVQAAYERGEIHGLVPDDEDRAACRDWAFGYATQLGGLDPDALEDDVFEAYFAIRAASEDADFLAAMAAERGEELREQELEDSRGFLADAAALLYDAWAPARLLAAERASTPLRRESPKVGRNDPCPCGSGKKHKKCCGA